MPPGTHRCANGAASLADSYPFPCTTSHRAAEPRDVRLWNSADIRTLLSFDESNLVRSTTMRERPTSRNRGAQQFKLHAIVFMVLYASLADDVWLSSAPVIAQTTSSTSTSSSGMHATSPLAPASTRSGIPLGATEVATPGTSPVSPSLSPGVGTGTCAGSDVVQSPNAPFDGGGLTGSTSLSCADSRMPSSPLPSSSSAGRVGIPLGATEIGGAGISPAAPVVGPSLSTNPVSANSPGNP